DHGVLQDLQQLWQSREIGWIFRLLQKRRHDDLLSHHATIITILVASAHQLQGLLAIDLVLPGGVIQNERTVRVLPKCFIPKVIGVHECHTTKSIDDLLNTLESHRKRRINCYAKVMLDGV